MYWLKTVAERGVGSAQYNLGLMFIQGKGTPKNFIKGYAWVSLAQATGEIKNTSKLLQTLEEKMTPTQIAEAQKLAAALWEKIPH